MVGKQERIDALELLGATFVDKKRDMLGALTLWKRAMEERSATKIFAKIRFSWYNRCIRRQILFINSQKKILFIRLSFFK